MFPLVSREVQFLLSLTFSSYEYVISVCDHFFKCFKFYLFYCLFYVLKGFACRFVCVPCRPGTCRGQKKASANPEQKLQVVVGCPVGTENRAQVLWNTQCS